MSKDTYSGGAIITGLLAFVAIWIYAISQWGLLFGLIFGWIPALIAGIVIGFLWPVVVVLVIVIALWFNSENQKSEERSTKIAQCIKEYRDQILLGNDGIKALNYFDNGYAVYKKSNGTWGATKPFEISSSHPYFTRSWKDGVQDKCREQISQ